MKLKILILTAAALGLAAQTAPSNMTANVPFAFEVNGKPMPAGSYRLLHSKERPYATVRHTATGRAFLVVVKPAGGVRLERVALTFDNLANRYVLTSISDLAGGGSIPVPRSRATRELPASAVISVAVTIAE